MTQVEAREKFGKRIQRCCSCYIAFHVKDLWWAADGNYYCEHCHDEFDGVAVHFNDYADGFDFTQLPSLQNDEL